MLVRCVIPQGLKAQGLLTYRVKIRTNRDREIRWRWHIKLAEYDALEYSDAVHECSPALPSLTETDQAKKHRIDNDTNSKQILDH